MSSIIDERVVEMQFDNREFEKNVATTLKTLDNLKSSLELDGATKGFESIDKASRNIDLSSFGDAIDTVSVKFSALETMAVAALFNITNRAVDAGIQLAKSLSLDQISAGWDKYGDKTTSVQTIIAATGKSIEEVEEQLDRLNWFTDETSYNFVDMTSNIGKFTSNGVDLEKAVTAMQGIAVEAAISGQNAQAASRAMYNFSQAMGAGVMKVQDWMSIENANMATKEFKEVIIETAKELGTLSEYSELTFEDFRSTLKDEWVTSDVMIAALEKYGGFSVALSEAMDEIENESFTTSSMIRFIDQYKEGTLDLAKAIELTGVDGDKLTGILENLSGSEYDLGRRAFKAAQEAKTFNEAIDATKDAVSTGWMKTFDLIFGNYEEAKVLWTDLANRLYDVFAISGETRNAILGIWKAGGGRNDLIDAFWNLWDAIEAIVEPIKKAFNDIFPSSIESSAKKLIDFTKKLKDSTAKMMVSEETAEKIQKTFRGLFAILDVLKQSLSIVTIPLKTLIGILGKGSNSVLGFTANLSDALVAFDDWVKKSELFVIAGNTIADILEKAAKGLSDFIKQVKTSYSEGGTGLSGVFQVLFDIISNFVEVLGNAFTTLTGIDSSNVIKSITDKIQKLSDSIVGFTREKLSFENIKKSVSDGLDSVKDKFNAFRNVDTSGLDELGERVEKRAESFKSLKKIGNFVSDAFSSMATKVTDSVSKISPAFSKMIKWGKDFANAIYEFLKPSLDSMKESLANADFNSFLDAFNALLGSGILIGLNSFANNLAKIPKSINQLPKALENATKKLPVISELQGVLNSVKDCFVAYQKELKAQALLKIAEAIGIIALSIFALSLLDSGKLAIATSAITVMMYMLNYMMQEFNSIAEAKTSTGDLIKIAGSLLIIAVAVGIVAGAIAKIGKLDTTAMAEAFGIVELIMFSMVKIAKELSQMEGKLVSGIGGLILLAIALRTMVGPIKQLGSLSLPELGKGLVGVAVSMGILIGALWLFSKINPSATLKTCIAMIALGTALTAMATAVTILGKMDIKELKAGLGASIALIIGLAAAAKLLPKDAVKIGLAITIMSVGLVSIANAVKVMASIKWNEMLIAMGALMLLLATFAIVMNKVDPGKAMGVAAALMLFAAALTVLAIPLKMLSTIPWENLLVALVALVGTIAIFGAAAAILAGIITPMIALAGAIALLGAGVALVGTGLLAFATGLSVLGAIGGTGITVLSLAITTLAMTIVSIMPMMIQAMMNGMVQIAESITSAAPKIANAVISLLGEFVAQFVENMAVTIPRILAALEMIIPPVLKFVNDNLPLFMETLSNLISSLLNLVVEKTPEMVEAFANMVIDTLAMLSEKIPDMIDAAAEFIVSFINGLADAIDEHATELKDAMEHLAQSMIDAICTFFGVESPSAKSPSTKFLGIGGNVIAGLIKGMWDKKDDAVGKITEIAKKMLEKLKSFVSDFKSIGGDMISGLTKGIKGAADDAVKAATGVVDDAVKSAKKLLGIHSPSKVFAEIGKYSDEGLAMGLSKYSSVVEGASEDVGETALDSMKNQLLKMADVISNDVDINANPVITPSLDLTKIQNGSRELDNMLNSDRTYSIASAIRSDMSDGSIMQTINVDNSDVINELAKLHNDIGYLSSAIQRMQIVMDSGALVGAISSDMDNALGQQLAYAGRGI